MGWAKPCAAKPLVARTSITYKGPTRKTADVKSSPGVEASLEAEIVAVLAQAAEKLGTRRVVVEEEFHLLAVRMLPRTPVGHPARHRLAEDFLERVRFLSDRVDLPAPRVLDLLSLRHRRRVNSWVWRPMEELQSLARVWKEAGEADLLQCNPDVVLRMTDAIHCLDVVKFLRDLGLDEKDLQKIIRHQPTVLRDGSPALERAAALADRLQLSKEDLARMVRKWPGCLLVHDDKVEGCLRLFEELGLTREEAIQVAIRCPSLMGNSLDEKLRPSLTFLLEKGLTRAEVAGAVRTCPQILSLNVQGKSARNKLRFLESMGIGMHEVARHPQLLTYSLENRLGPRLTMLAQQWDGARDGMEWRERAFQMCIPFDSRIAKVFGMPLDKWIEYKDRWAEHECPRLLRQWYGDSA